MTKLSDWYFTNILLVINRLCQPLNINIHPLAVFYRIGRDSLHYERKCPPWHLCATCRLIYRGCLERTSFKAFMIQDETVTIPSEQLDTLPVL